MQTKHGCRRHCVRSWGLAGCLLLLLCWPVLGLESRTQEMQQDSSERRARVTVDRGQLSVDLNQADIRTVLAQIAGQAGVTVYIGRIEGRTISTQFTGVELTQGLQRLLRLAALNYMILYTRGPTGAVVMQEVRVFGEDQGGTAAAPLIAQRDVKDTAAVEATETDAAQRFAAALAQAAPSPSVAVEENEAARRFREALQRAGEQTSPQEESEAARRFREALEQAQQRGAGAGPPKEFPHGRQETGEGTQNGAGTAK